MEEMYTLCRQASFANTLVERGAWLSTIRARASDIRELTHAQQKTLVTWLIDHPEKTSTLFAEYRRTLAVVVRSCGPQGFRLFWRHVSATSSTVTISMTSSEATEFVQDIIASVATEERVLVTVLRITREHPGIWTDEWIEALRRVDDDVLRKHYTHMTGDHCLFLMDKILRWRLPLQGKTVSWKGLPHGVEKYAWEALSAPLQDAYMSSVGEWIQRHVPLRAQVCVSLLKNSKHPIHDVVTRTCTMYGRHVESFFTDQQVSDLVHSLDVDRLSFLSKLSKHHWYLKDIKGKLHDVIRHWVERKKFNLLTSVPGDVVGMAFSSSPVPLALDIGQ